MGGYGSGRTSDRGTVDGAISLDINSLVRKRIMGLHWLGGGCLRWVRVSDGRETASCGYMLDTISEPMRLKVSYTCNDTENISTDIRIDAIPGYFGGKRLYLICPECGRRTWYLYLRRSVKCRLCHNLTYKSCKESHTSDRFYTMMAAKLGQKMEHLRRAMTLSIKQDTKDRERQERLSRRGRKRKYP